MPNLRLKKKENLSSFRKIAIGTWRTAYDPSVYGQLRLRADAMLAYIEEFRRRTGKKLTISHVMAKATALSPATRTTAALLQLITQLPAERQRHQSGPVPADRCI